MSLENLAFQKCLERQIGRPIWHFNLSEVNILLYHDYNSSLEEFSSPLSLNTVLSETTIPFKNLKLVLEKLDYSNNDLLRYYSRYHCDSEIISEHLFLIEDFEPEIHTEEIIHTLSKSFDFEAIISKICYTRLEDQIEFFKISFRFIPDDLWENIGYEYGWNRRTKPRPFSDEIFEPHLSKIIKGEQQAIWEFERPWEDD